MCEKTINDWRVGLADCQRCGRTGCTSDCVPYGRFTDCVDCLSLEVEEEVATWH